MGIVSLKSPFQGCREMGILTPKPSFPDPAGQKRRLDVAGQKIAARQFLSLNCLAVTPTAGAILKEEEKPSHVETIWARVIASQKLSRDNGERQFLPRDIKMSHRALFS